MTNRTALPVKYKVSPLSITSVVLSILVPPVGLLLGIVSLLVLRGRSERGKGLAICAVVIGALLSLFLLFGIASWLSVTAVYK